MQISFFNLIFFPLANNFCGDLRSFIQKAETGTNSHMPKYWNFFLTCSFTFQMKLVSS